MCSTNLLAAFSFTVKIITHLGYDHTDKVV
uniref:Uncharacterized protein n=1 Tax=Anguilla anguilla TaxID=7936 RepID=A0A0E9WB75_ANGAN